MRTFLLLLSLGIAAASFAQSPHPLVPSAPPIAARSFLLLDYHSQQTLAGKTPDERIEPASLTKLMTAYLTFAALKEKKIQLTQNVPVSDRAWKAEGSRMFIEPKKPVTVEELMRGMIVQSGNDACIALAELIAGSEEAFAQTMNAQAQRLGMKNTSFMNSTGLPNPQHYSTAQDLALLAIAIIRDFPEYHPLYAMKEYRYNNITQANRNRLLWSDPTVDGMKTGYTENAGYCLITSAKRGERRLISVVVGAASESARATESQKLLNYGFQYYDSVKLYEKNQAVASLPIWKGASNSESRISQRSVREPAQGPGRQDESQPRKPPAAAGAGCRRPENRRDQADAGWQAIRRTAGGGDRGRRAGGNFRARLGFDQTFV